MRCDSKRSLLVAHAQLYWFAKDRKCVSSLQRRDSTVLRRPTTQLRRFTFVSLSDSPSLPNQVRGFPSILTPLLNKTTKQKPYFNLFPYFPSLQLPMLNHFLFCFLFYVWFIVSWSIFPLTHLPFPSFGCLSFLSIALLLILQFVVVWVVVWLALTIIHFFLGLASDFRMPCLVVWFLHLSYLVLSCKLHKIFVACRLSLICDIGFPSLYTKVY
jgi:hypothetical protein